MYLSARTFEALKAIRRAEALAEEREERFWSAELHRLRGVFLAAIGAEEAQIEASFCEAIKIAREQKSISLENAQKQPMRNTVAKKRARLGDADCGYRFDPDRIIGLQVRALPGANQI